LSRHSLPQESVPRSGILEQAECTYEEEEEEEEEEEGVSLDSSSIPASQPGLASLISTLARDTSNQALLTELLTKLLQDQPSKAVSTEAEESQEGEFSRAKLWASFTDSVVELVPSVPQMILSPKKRRTISLTDRPVERKTLPLHPQLAATFDKCLSEVTRGNDKADFLEQGKFLKVDREFQKNFWPPGDVPKFHLPALRSEALRQLAPDLQDSPVALKDLQLQMLESAWREQLCILSHSKWALEAHRSLFNRLLQGEDPKVLEPLFTSLVLNQDSMAAYSEELAATQLSNLVLRRRDAVLDQVPSLSQEAALQLRGQPLLGRRLLDIPSELSQQHRESRKTDVLLEAIQASLKPSKFVKKRKGTFKRPKSSSSSASAAASSSAAVFRPGQGVQQSVRPPFQSSVQPARGRGRGRGRVPHLFTAAAGPGSGRGRGIARGKQ